MGAQSGCVLSVPECWNRAAWSSALTVSLGRPLRWTVEFLFGNTEPILELWDAGIYDCLIPNSFAAVSPRILSRSSSLSPGIDMIWSTGVVFHGKG